MILLPLTFFMLLFLLLTLLLMLSFRSTNALLEENILRRTPFTHRTMTLVQQSEQLRGLLFRYMQADSLFVQASLLEQIHQNLIQCCVDPLHNSVERPVQHEETEKGTRNHCS